MKRTDFEKILSILSNDLYSFAFVLIPDDLQAGQLIVDSIQNFLISQRDRIEHLFEVHTQDIGLEVIPIKKDLLKLVYDLAKKRYQQIKLSIDDFDQKNGFFSMEMDEKAVLFLKEKLKLTVEDIAVITFKTKAETLAYLYSSRLKMIENIPYEIQSGVNA